MERMSKPAVQGFTAFCAVSVIEFCKCNDFGFRHSMYIFTFNCIKSDFQVGPFFSELICRYKV